MTRNELKDFLDLADTITSIFSQAIREGIDPTQKKVVIEELRKSAKQIRRIRSKMD
jgi:hypothetical protein